MAPERERQRSLRKRGEQEQWLASRKTVSGSSICRVAGADVCGMGWEGDIGRFRQ